MNELYTEFRQHLRKIADVSNAISVLGWDKEVNMPPKGAAFRTQQVATLSGISHELFVDEKFQKLVAELEKGKDNMELVERRNIELTAKKLRKSTLFSTDFIIKSSKTVSEGYHAWLKAKEVNDYNVFKPVLGKLVEILREKAETIGYVNHPYEALMDEYEAGMTVPELDTLFEDVKAKLVAFTKKIREAEQVENDFLHLKYDKKKQWDFGIEILRRMGYDFEAGRQDLSPHPFTTNSSPLDVRVTTRIDENFFGSMTWSCIHEGGHALYEQGIPTEDYGTPVGTYVSLGIHESQSRLWENNVGRSFDYWKHNYELAQDYFPENLADVELEDFFKAINKVYPDFIRVESDELHYHFHILIRYEIEKGLIDGTYEVEGLDKVWNAKYKEYLGIDVKDDNKGILQDIHWAYGSIGYFPTYSLGSFYAAQMFAKAKQEIPDLIEQIQNGDTSDLLLWLREKIHQHGNTYSATELCERVTGEALNFQYFMDYAQEKYGRIYGI